MKAPPRDRMMGWLARREYGFDELVERGMRDLELTRPQSEAVVQRLTDDGLQCDQRFVESLIRSRVRKGQGPLKIRADLQSKGISDPVIRDALDAAEVDWFELARHRLERKFGRQPVDDEPKEQARRLRFLAALGYPQSMAYALIKD
ncbi:regulatory protein RecX [Litorivicinus lipolyticus]|uniref:regulatory protein RecX n=1 Tax=Litorivicinus lipolyticus TaxID=418701 RepID=UPI003B59385E